MLQRVLRVQYRNHINVIRSFSTVSEQNVKFDIDASNIATVTLSNPKKKNAFSDMTIASLTDIFQSLQQNTKVKGVILQSEGTHFSAGADLKWMQKTAKYTYEENKEDAFKLSNMLNLLYQLPIPTICLCQGPALGGGLGLISVCDYSIAVQNSWFMFSETKLGLIPATISPFIINRIGTMNARRYFVTAEMIPSEEAKRIGLIDDIVENEEQLQERKEKWVKKILQNSPYAIRQSKELVNHMTSGIVNEENLKYSIEMLANIRKQPDAKEGIQAFFEKRKPNWN